ncbi:unnamed protein product, partial [Durusdinium trenchii]
MAAPHAAHNGTTPTEFQQQVVRDLHWVMASPHLLQESQSLSIWPDDRGRKLAERSRDWLLQLDSDPSPLHEWLLAQEDFHRIGHYFAALVEFWLRWCPVLNATKVLARQQVTAEEPAPERPGQEDYTTNQLKFLARLEGDEALHLEAAFHFSLARGPREVDVVASRFAGGFLHESLCWRILEARIRARLAAEASVKKQLQEWLGASPSFQFLLRGRVFFEARSVMSMRSLKDPLKCPASEGLGLLSSSQPVGWWTWDPSELLTAPGAHESRWVPLLYKRYWLSPVVCMEQSDGSIRTEGDSKINLKSIESFSGEEFVRIIVAHRHLKARNPVLVSEVQRQANGRWEEVSKGFVLPRKWSMAPESATAMRSSDLKAETSITRLQRSMEQVLQAEGIDAWWCQVERLELAAEDTERRSAEAQERRASALWQPPKAREALPKAGLVEALESRWASTNEDELCDTRAAVLCHLAETADLTQTLIDLLLEIFQRCRQPRALGHVVLDAAQRLLRRRDKVFYDRPLTRGASAKWQQLIERAASGMFCPKVVAKASKQLGMEAVATKGRQESVADLLARFEDFNFPDRPIESTHREATLTGAVQLCTLRLQQLQRQREARRCREETEDSEDQAETGGCCLGGFACDSNCCLAVCRCEARCCCRCRCDLLLRVDEVQPLFLWCASHGELAPAKALAQTELCGAIAQSLEADLAALLQASGVSLGRRQRRRVNEPKAAAAAPTPATAKEAFRAPLPPLELWPDVELHWIECLSGVSEEILARTQLEGGVIALDAEWKPFQSGEAPTPMELLQLAVPSRCWLLDLRAVQWSALQALLRQLCSLDAPP